MVLLQGVDASAAVWRSLHGEKLNVLDAVEILPADNGGRFLVY